MAVMGAWEIFTRNGGKSGMGGGGLEWFYNDLPSLSILGKKKQNVFLASNFLTFVSNRFAVLQIFYNQLRWGNRAESCL